jgi:hypothetical protein
LPTILSDPLRLPYEIHQIAPALIRGKTVAKLLRESSEAREETLFQFLWPVDADFLGNYRKISREQAQSLKSYTREQKLSSQVIVLAYLNQ